MPELTSPKQLCETIWDLEKRHDLLHRPFQGVKVWQLLRMEIYYKLAQEIGVYNTPHTNKDTLWDSLRALPSIPDVFMKHPLRGRYHKDILVFDHMRKVPLDGVYIDVYTKHLIDGLDEADFDVIESVYLGKHLSPRSPNRKYLDCLAVSSYIATHLKRVSFTAEELSAINDVENSVFEATHVRLPLRQIFAKEIIHFDVSYRFYLKLLRKRRPKKIYLVVSYSFYKRALIAAAKTLGIETLEIQHGTLSPYHLGYNFPNDEGPLDYFPDRFLAFGNYWKHAAAFPLHESHIETVGFPYFHEQKKQYESITKNPDQILFISQGVIGKRLAALAVSCARQMKDKQIVLKLHPGEYDRWRQEYPELVEAAPLDNMRVIENNNTNLYAYLAESAYQVGVFSTAIYEGLAFGCKTFIADMPGSEYMDDLVAKQVVHKISSAEDLVSKLNLPVESSFCPEDFFYLPPKS